MMMNTLNKFLLHNRALLNTQTRILLKQTQPVLTRVATRGFYYPDANHHHLNQEVSLKYKPINFHFMFICGSKQGFGKSYLNKCILY